MAKLKWYTHIEPYLDDIVKMRKEERLIEEQIADKLGVGWTTFKEYKAGTNAAAIKLGVDTSSLSAALRKGSKGLKYKIYDNIFKAAEYKREPDFKEIWEPNVYTGVLELKRREIYPDRIIKGSATDRAMAIKILDKEARDILSNNIEVKVNTEDDRITIVNDAPGVHDETD